MNKTLVEKLNDLKRLGSMPRGHHAVTGLLSELFDLLPAKDYEAIAEARDSLLAGNGRNALDMVVNNLIQKARHYPPDGRKGRTFL